MHDMSPFERKLSTGFQGLMGPSRPVDDAAIFTAIKAQSTRRGFRTLLSAAKFAAAAVVVLFGGLLLVALPLGGEGVGVPGAQEALPAPFGPARNGVLVTIDLPGPLIEVDPAMWTTRPLLDGSFHGAEFSNDGRRLFLIRGRALGHASVDVVDADGSGLREVVPAGGRPAVAWAPDSQRIAIARDGWLSIQDVDGGTAIRHELGLDVDNMRWRPGHEQLVMAADSDGDHEYGLYLVGADGSDLRPLVPESGWRSVVMSPDGTTIAYASQGPRRRIHLLDIDTEADRELSYEGFEGIEAGPIAFAPDGSRLLISQSAEGPAHDEVLQVRAIGYPADEFRDAIVPVAGEGPVVVLGSQIHAAIGGPGGSALFSPDGALVMAAYTQGPEGTWLFDTATGKGSRLRAADIGEPVSWQRLSP